MASRKPQLMGPGEVSDALGVTRMTLSRWRADYGFPAPLAELSIGPVWDGGQVRAWHREHKRTTKRTGPKVALGTTAKRSSGATRNGTKK